MCTNSSHIKSCRDVRHLHLQHSALCHLPLYPVYCPGCLNLCARAEDMFKSLNYHGQDLTFGDLEIQERSAVERSEEGADPGLSVGRSTMMVLKSTEGL